jgi:general secretion pathway protein E
VRYEAVGCALCNHNGYRGRYGVYELMRVDEEMQRLIHAGAAEQTLRARALAQGMRTLRDDGLCRVRAGETSLEEVLRVTRD